VILIKQIWSLLVIVRETKGDRCEFIPIAGKSDKAANFLSLLLHIGKTIRNRIIVHTTIILQVKQHNIVKHLGRYPDAAVLRMKNDNVQQTAQYRRHFIFTDLEKDLFRYIIDDMAFIAIGSRGKTIDDLIYEFM